MKKLQLKRIIKESIKELMTEQINPSDGRRIYGCKCDVGQGIVVTQQQIDDYNAANPPQQNPYGGGMTGAIWHDYGNGTVGSLPAGPNQDLHLICPENAWYGRSNAVVDCNVPQEGQLVWQNQGGANVFRIAINGVMPEWDSTPIQSYQTSTCGGPGVYPHDCSPPPVSGCMDSLAINYDSSATMDDGTCEYDFSDPSLNQMTRICTCEDAPIDNTGQPNSYYACNGGTPLGIPLRFSSTYAPALNLINHEAQVGNIISGVPISSGGAFPPNTIWLIIDVLGIGTGGAAAVVYNNINGCPTNLSTSGNVPGVGYVGTKPTDTKPQMVSPDLQFDTPDLDANKSQVKRMKELANIK